MTTSGMSVLERVRKSAEVFDGTPVGAVLRDAVGEIELLNDVFDIRWEADMRAVKRWRAERPDRQFTLPDHADLCVWLMAQLDGVLLAKEERDGA